MTTQNTHSTQKSLDDFFESSLIWEDIQDELSMWLDDIHTQLENNSGELSSRTLDRLGGNAEALRNAMDIGEALGAQKTKNKFDI